MRFSFLYSVGAPAFMRGKERFSAPGKIVFVFLRRFSAGIEKAPGLKPI